MLTSDLVAGLLAGYGVAIPIGAIAPLLVTLTARTSMRTGIAAALGVATVDGCYALVAVLFGAALAPVLRHIEQPMRWTAFAVLIVIAIRTAMSRSAEPPDIQPRHAYLTLVGLTALNPTTIVYFAALVLGRHQGLVFAPAAFAASASWQLILVCGGRLLSHTVTSPRGRLVTAWTGSAVIAVLAIRLAVQG